MKKHNTLFVVIITILFVALLTWILPITYLQGELVEGERIRAGLVNIFAYPAYTFYNFIYVLLYLLGIGAIYGVLNKTGAYRLLLEKVVKFVKKCPILWLVLTVLILAVITSFTGFTFELLIVLPFIAAIVLMLGHNKLTAALISVGSVSIGVIGSIYSKLVVGGFQEIIQTLNYTDLFLAKIILLVVAACIWIFAIIYYTRKEEKPKDIEESFLVPTKTTTKKIKVWPLATALIVFLLVLVLASIDWIGAFKVEFFTKTLESIKTTKVLDKYIVLVVGLLVVLINVLTSVYRKKKNVKETKFMSTRKLVVTICVGVVAFLALLKVLLEDVFNATNILTKALELIKADTLINSFNFDILLGIIKPFGEWGYPDYFVWMLIFILAIKFMYRVKFDDVVDHIGEGCKKVLYGAIVVMISYTVLMLTASHPVILTALKPVLELFDSANVLTYALTYPLCTLVSALFNMDFTYYGSHPLTLQYVLSYFTNVSTYPLCALITQAMYGLAIMIAPTSAVLLFNLSLLDIKYTTWLKKTILIFLTILLVCLITFFIIAKYII